MNKRFIGVLTFAFIVALGASLVLYRVLLKQPQTTKAAATVSIALAGRDLEIGTVLKEEDVKLADWPGTVPTGAATRALLVPWKVTAVVAVLATSPVPVSTTSVPIGPDFGL